MTMMSVLRKQFFLGDSPSTDHQAFVPVESTAHYHFEITDVLNRMSGFHRRFL